MVFQSSRIHSLIVRMICIGILLFLAVPSAMVMAGEQGMSEQRVNELVSGNNQFAVELYQEISASDERRDNTVISPFSISTALAMTYAGSRGNTERQMADVLHFNLPGEKLQPGFSALLDQLTSKKEKGYQLHIANALWGQKGDHFSGDYMQLVNKYYRGAFNTVDFTNEPEISRQTINQWVDEQTSDKIKELLQKGDIKPETRLILTNAIYFQGNWADPFENECTTFDSFFLQPNNKVSVAMMHQDNEFSYAETDEVQVLELPYAGYDMSMIILLPKGGFKEFDAALTADKIQRWLGQLQTEKVAVSLPKFKFTCRYHLDQDLPAMGMVDAFTSMADFSGMTGNKDLYIAKVIHQAVIDVNEKGCEAAAATVATMELKAIYMTRDPKVFTADHPFVFLIRHRVTGSILFMGNVVNPLEE